MSRHSSIPVGCWPALMRDEIAAAYAGERTVDGFLGRVGSVWPKPFMETGSGKGKYRVWRKIDLDKVIDPDGSGVGGDPEPL